MAWLFFRRMPTYSEVFLCLGYSPAPGPIFKKKPLAALARLVGVRQITIPPKSLSKIDMNLGLTLNYLLIAAYF